MTDDLLATRFEANRSHLHSVAYRMLGTDSDADDAVQQAWLRLSRSDPDEIDNLGGWLTTVVARVCLDMLRARTQRREESLDGGLAERIPGGNQRHPEDEALLADAIGPALLVVLDTLAPAERLAFVLHDMFAVPFEEIAPIVDRSPTAARQLASRARRRVHGAEPATGADHARRRAVVDAFLAASRGGDFEALLAVLDPEVVLRADLGPLGGSREVRGAEAVMSQARAYARLGLVGRPALINGAAGLVATRDGEPFSVGGFTIRNRRIVAIDILADRERLRALDLTVLDG
jgi:RNA polymerase sigma factor (sigma-70 family)